MGTGEAQSAFFGFDPETRHRSRRDDQHRHCWATGVHGGRGPHRRQRCRLRSHTVSVPSMETLEQYLSSATGRRTICCVKCEPTRRGPSIQVSAESGHLLALFVRLTGATRVLEVGTLFGYSGIWNGYELPPGGRLDTDRDLPRCTPTPLSTGSRRAGLWPSCCCRAPGCGGRRVGDVARSRTTWRSSTPTSSRTRVRQAGPPNGRVRVDC